MNPFVFACIAPHGGEIIPELQEATPERMAATIKSIVKLGQQMAAANPDCIVVLSPHSTGWCNTTRREAYRIPIL